MDAGREDEMAAEEPSTKRTYQRPSIVWEEPLEIAGTLKASNVEGTLECGGVGALHPGFPPGFPPGPTS